MRILHILDHSIPLHSGYAFRSLALLTEQRRDFVADRTQASNRLTAALKCYYPLALELVGGSLTDKMGLDFLRRWPNLAALKKAKP